LQVSLAFEAFRNNPELWGQLLAETAVHIADAMSAEGYWDRNALFANPQESLLAPILLNPIPVCTALFEVLFNSGVKQSVQAIAC